MKVSLFSTFDSGGGAAKAAYRLHRGLIDRGVDSTFVVRNKTTKDSTVVSLNDFSSVGYSAAFLQHYIERILFRLCVEDRRINFTFNRGPLWSKFVKYYTRDASLVGAFWCGGGFVDPRLHISSSLPCFTRFSDMMPFTGGCHFAGGCDQYSSLCVKCPKVKFDISRALVRNSKYRKIKTSSLRPNDIYVAPCSWMLDRAKESKQYSEDQLKLIYTGVDINLFQPMDRMTVRRRLGLPERPTILLSSYAALNDPRKGALLLRDVFSRLNERRIEYQILVMGAEPINGKTNLTSAPLYSLGYLTDDIAIATVVNAADLYLAPFVEDNFPNTVLEACACGVPTVAFAVGGIPEIIKNNINGYLVQSADVDQYVRSVFEVMENASIRTRLSIEARASSLAFDQSRALNLYLELFQLMAK